MKRDEFGVSLWEDIHDLVTLGFAGVFSIVGIVMALTGQGWIAWLPILAAIGINKLVKDKWKAQVDEVLKGRGE